LENKKESPDLEKAASVWRTAPRKTTAIFLLAVFLTFTILAFANDIIEMGHQPPMRFALAIALSGLFAVAYAVAGISLRGKIWKAAIPLFVLQFLVMGVLGNMFPSTPQPVQLDAGAMGRMQSRLAFDGLATIVAMSLSYAGFVIVFVKEGRRHGLVHAEMSRQQALLEGELAAAREVQQVIVPEQVEAVPGFNVDSVYQPAQQVGGDFFQVLPAGEGGLLVVVGDVAGKGLPAAMLVSVLVGAIRGVAAYTKDPAELLASLNERLMGRTQGGFSTALVARITADGSVTIANAGHLSPYLDGREIELHGALPLGVVKSAAYQVTHFHLPQGSRLTFYSDGVIEAQNEKGELFGFERGRAISTQPAAAIVEAATQFGQEDDITVVTIERLAAGEESTGRGAARTLATA
jgi:serine/threonine protein phosphatase PrpC